MAKQGETAVPGGTRGRRQGGETRKEQISSKGYEEMGGKGGHVSKAGCRLQGGTDSEVEQGLDVDESTEHNTHPSNGSRKTIPVGLM
ncbi:hypothetical protein K7X08_035662 [Anisodus acutangulus]|uniref:Uncharacterized protein n=1 Tax=Anisodus acutangulus TaxID=402998 RepID=A0A9Q1LJJ7_9SOLA|nr:hypothetical protein K7X08_035662 [Anisodus acutangulus]